MFKTGGNSVNGSTYSIRPGQAAPVGPLSRNAFLRGSGRCRLTETQVSIAERRNPQITPINKFITLKNMKSMKFC